MNFYLAIFFLISWVTPVLLLAQSWEVQHLNMSTVFQSPKLKVPLPLPIRLQQSLPEQVSKKEEPSKEQEISIPSHGSWILKGKLAIPATFVDKNYIAFVLVHGSGPSDMDHTLSGAITATGKPTKLFKDISDSLVKAGFVVLRYNKRGVLGWDETKQQPSVDPKIYQLLSVSDFIADVEAAVRYLHELPNPPRKIVLLGISEGSMIIPRIPAANAVNGLILLSAPANRLDVIVRYQLVERPMRWTRQLVDEDHDGLITKEEAARHTDFPLDFQKLDKDLDDKISFPEFYRGLEEQWKTVEEAWKKMPWYQSHLVLEPTSKVLPNYQGPILILHGELDDQVPLSEATLLASKLQESGHPDFTLKVFPGLGHGFAPPLDGWKPTVGPIDPAVLDYLSHWVSSRF